MRRSFVQAHMGLLLAALFFCLALARIATAQQAQGTQAPAPAGGAHAGHAHGSEDKKEPALSPYRKDGRCGPLFPAPGSPEGALCNANFTKPCCSASGRCGSGDSFCKCFGCIDYKNDCNGKGYIHGDHCHCDDGYQSPVFSGFSDYRRDLTRCAPCGGVGKLSVKNNVTICTCNKGYMNRVSDGKVSLSKCMVAPPAGQDPPAKTFCPQGFEPPLSLDLFRTDFRCGEAFKNKNGTAAWCHPGTARFCCSPKGWCGNSKYHCTSPGSINYRGVQYDYPTCKPIVTPLKKQAGN